jgi:hypothetical protein
VVRSIISERQLWKKLKNETTGISWTRLENWALFGTPDLLGYSSSGTFFTVELKTTSPKKAKFVRFSPHQISFHIKHEKNTFVLVACTLDQGLVRLSPSRHPPFGAFSLFIFLISFFRIILMYFILNLLNIF